MWYQESICPLRVNKFDGFIILSNYSQLSFLYFWRKSEFSKITCFCSPNHKFAIILTSARSKQLIIKRKMKTLNFHLDPIANSIVHIVGFIERTLHVNCKTNTVVTYKEVYLFNNQNEKRRVASTGGSLSAFHR